MKQFIKPWRNNKCVAGTTTKLMGSFTKYQDPLVFRKTLKLTKKDIITAEQIHKNHVVIVTKDDFGSPVKNADGLVTKDNNLFLVIFTADCIPIFFSDLKNRVIGLTHAGRRGSLMNISGNTVKMMKKIGAEVKNIKVYLGPHICRQCYGWDLAKVNLSQLKESGIPLRNITVSKFCTFEQRDIFYSYRREKPDTTIFHEMISFIALK